MKCEKDASNDLQNEILQQKVALTITQLGDLFDRLDLDRTGYISPKAVFEGLVSNKWDEEAALQVSDMIDVNNNGKVTKNSFIRFLSNEPGTFTEERDDMMVTWRQFREIDVDRNGTISLSEIEATLKLLKDEHHKKLAKALTGAASRLKPADAGLTFRDFSSLVSTLPRVRGERVQWVRSLGLDGELARLLQPGTLFDGLSGLLQMSDEQQTYACDTFCHRLRILFRDGLQKLRDQAVVASGVKSEAQETNSKFFGTAGAFHGTFAKLKEFYRGPEGLIGQPNPKLMEGMHREHCKRDSSKRFFVTPNYLLRTTAEWEWLWVQNPKVESLPEELQTRLKSNKYPGEVGDVLKECEVVISILKGRFEFAALKICKEDLCARLQNLIESCTQTYIEPFIEDDCTVSATENNAAIQIRVSSNNRISDAKRAEILVAFAKFVMKLDKNYAMEAADVSGSDSDWKIDIKISKTEMAKYLQVKLGNVLGSLQDEKQRLNGARIVPSEPTGTGSGHIVVVIAIPSSDLDLKSKISTALSGFTLGETELNFRANEYEYCSGGDQMTGLHRQGRKALQGRTALGTFSEFFKSDPICEKQARFVKKGLAELIMEEVIALRLYTGPLFILYNAVLREFPFEITDLLRDKNLEMNRFETTIFVICSGISKLSRLTDVPPNRLLYRGLGGMLLPDEFWKDSDEGFKGGVEYGLMSLTTKRSVAVEYSGIRQRRGILFEIQAGRIDIGASISFLSQYPGEEEYLMPPLSCMEVIGHPRVEKTSDGEIIVFPLRVNVNLKSLTVEGLTQRRKDLHLSMAKNLGEEIIIAAAALIEEFKIVEQRRAEGLFLEPISGDFSKITIAQEENSAKLGRGSKNFGTVGAPSLWVSRNKVYFEVTVKRMSPTGDFRVGWAGTNFQGNAVGSDESSWSICKSGIFWQREARSGNSFGKAVELGTIIGLALDLESGVMRVSLNGVEKGVFGGSGSLSVKPGPTAGGALFPAISGCDGCEITLNTGRDSFRYAPPSTEYASLAAFCSDRFPLTAGYDAAVNFLRIMGLTKATLGEKFERVIRVHKTTEHAEFNNDENYKRLLIQALDWKVSLLAQLETVIMLRKEGATLEQLKVCADADAADFHGKRLEDECPGLLWRRDILHGNFLTERVSIPLTLPACQVSLIWEGVLASESVNKVAMGGFARDHEILDLSSLLPSLNLLDSNMQGSRYGSAVVGLLMASNKLAQRAPNHTRVVSEVNLRGIEFSPQCTDQLVQAVTLGSVGGWVTRVNKLNLEGSQAVNLKHALCRDDKPLVSIPFRCEGRWSR